MNERHKKDHSHAPASQVKCRTCGARFNSDSEFTPFCSQRCRDADLNKWFTESYRISREIKESDLETND